MCAQPIVSVIIPVYNTEKYLCQCLDSIINQTLKNIEIICVDDGSTDGSLEILNDYSQRDSRLVVLHQQNLYAGTARNRGLENAKGKYVYFMDSDDYCDLQLLDHTVRCAEETNAEIVVFDYYRFCNTTGSKEYKAGLLKSLLPSKKEVFSYEDIPDEICSLVNPTPWNKLFLRDFIAANELHFLEIPTTNDITFATLSVMMAKRVSYIKEALIYYRTNLKNSVSSKKKDNINNVVTAVLSVDQQAQKLSHYAVIRNSIRKFIIRNLFLALERYAGGEDEASYVYLNQKIDAILFGYPLFIDLTSEDIGDEELFNQILLCKRRASERNDFTFTPRIIVSLTSFPARIEKVHLAICSIVQQTRKPDKILLWLAKEQFPNGERDLPKKLLDYQKVGLEIEWCEEDIRPHKKYFYTMQKYPYDIVITVDDDLLYNPRMIELLFLSYFKFPHAVSCMRAHLMTADKAGNIAKYSEWVKEYSGIVDKPSMSLFSTSGAGTLYPPFCMDQRVFDLNAIKTLCINADDLWLKIMQVLHDTPVVLVHPNEPLVYIEGTQAVSLREKNLYANENDVQLANILGQYDTKDQKSCSCIAYKLFSEEIPLKNEKEHVGEGLAADKRCVLLTQRVEWAEKEIQLLRNSTSYKIGCCITWLPRKISRGIRCYRENGFHYTVSRIKEKILVRIKRGIS